MINPDVVVVIASVPWRQENLCALLDDLSKQTMVPCAITLLLDGYASDVFLSATHESLRDVSVAWRMFVPPRGPGERWRLLAQRAVSTDPRVHTGLPRKTSPTFAVVIDDDFRVGPDYIEKTIAGFTGDDVGMVAWSGTTWLSGSPLGDGVVDLWAAAAGLSAVRVAAMAGIESYETTTFSVGDYFGVGGDDEALVSYWMWKQGLRIVRPAYPPPAIRSVDELQHDRRSAHRNHNQKHYMQRIALLQAHGWAPKDPPAWENPMATKGRTRKGP